LLPEIGKLYTTPLSCQKWESCTPLCCQK
jgi:hypothetical protein